MRAIASGISLARELGVGVEVAWSVNKWLRARFEDVFQPEALPAPVRNVSSFKELVWYDEPRKRNLYLPGALMPLCGRRLLSDTDFAAISDVAQAAKAVLEAGKGLGIRSGLPFHTFSVEDYRRWLMPAPEVSALAGEYASRLGARGVGLHIRRTDNAQSCANSPTSLFEQRMEKILADEPGTKFFLASDSPEVKARLGRKFGDSVLTYPSVLDRGSKAGIRDAAVEMLILASTGRILGSYYSSYSEAAAMLGGVPLEQLSVKP